MFSTLVVVAIGACLLSLAASFVMTKASNLSPAWNIAIGGMIALTFALVLYLLVLAIERAAFVQRT